MQYGVPLLIMSGIYDGWKVIFYELSDVLFVFSFWFGLLTMQEMYMTFFPTWWFVIPELELGYQIMVHPN